MLERVALCSMGRLGSSSSFLVSSIEEVEKKERREGLGASESTALIDFPARVSGYEKETKGRGKVSDAIDQKNQSVDELVLSSPPPISPISLNQILRLTISKALNLGPHLLVSSPHSNISLFASSSSLLLFPSCTCFLVRPTSTSATSRSSNPKGACRTSPRTMASVDEKKSESRSSSTVESSSLAMD